MFQQSLLDVASTDKKRPWTVGVSFMFQMVLIGLVILIPLLRIEALPKQQLLSFLAAPSPPPPPPPPPAPAGPKVVHKIVSEVKDGHLLAPREVPTEILSITEESSPTADTSGPPGGVPGGVPGGDPNGIIGGILKNTPTVAVPPPPPPAPKQEPPKRIVVGGNVQAAMVISRPTPQYPPVARQAGISGCVRLEAMIDEQGRITDLKFVSGHPLLVQSAIDAVRQWRYRPTVLNGIPVYVATVVDVNFSLEGRPSPGCK